MGSRKFALAWHVIRRRGDRCDSRGRSSIDVIAFDSCRGGGGIVFPAKGESVGEAEQVEIGFLVVLDVPVVGGEVEEKGGCARGVLGGERDLGGIEVIKEEYTIRLYEWRGE